MNLKHITDSIITRLVLLGIAIVLLGGAVRYFALTIYLREDLEKVVSAQLTALADYVARDVDEEIVKRQELLLRIAATLPVNQLNQPDILMAWLAERHTLQPLFSEGMTVIDLNGTVLADYPPKKERERYDHNDRDYFQSISSGKAMVWHPVIDRVAKIPVLPMSAPIKDSDGKVRAILVGVTALSAPDFLDLLQKTHVGESGGFLLISPQEQIVVAATRPELVFRSTARPGVNPLHDRAMTGFRGSGITVNAQGVEEISAIASVPSTGWFVVARLPTVEAFTSIGRTQRLIFKNTVAIFLLLTLILPIILYFMFRPLLRAAKQADRMTLDEIPLAPLPVTRNDEVGHLTAAFNRLLNKLVTNRAELDHIAHHDILTGLPNRQLLDDRMKQAHARAQRNNTRLAILYLDLDGFKPINDELGHDAGDETLKQVATRLQKMVRSEDTLARIGGDEFVILLADLNDKANEAAETVANKCLEAFQLPYNVMGSDCQLGASIGIAVGNAANSPDSLLNAADKSMYQSKKTGRGKISWASIC